MQGRAAQQNCEPLDGGVTNLVRVNLRSPARDPTPRFVGLLNERWGRAEKAESVAFGDS